MSSEFGQPLVISELLSAYRSRRTTPEECFGKLLRRIDTAADHHVWITRLSDDQVMSYVRALQDKSMDDLPLFGVPFVIKDNIDLADIPTTAACPAFAYTPQHSAFVVQRLIAAGAIPLGKANMDQFATGLVGVRSPFGAGKNSFNPEYVSGGSSSGSALAVALGMASFALGTDTAGSGRVPAAFNNLIGLKPSCGRLSNNGLVPACRSLDCISIFALTAADAAAVLKVAQGYDADDPWSRPVTAAPSSGRMQADSFRVGIPRPAQLQFFGDDDYARLFVAACRNMESLGGQLVELDFTPLFEAARLLYEGPWVAERYAAIEAFIEQQPESLHPVTRDITLSARGLTAVQTFQAQYRLQSLKRAAAHLLQQADVFMTPTAGTIYRIADVEADPIRRNSNLGYYTNFMNLLDLAAIAVPSGFRKDGLPFGVTLFAERDTDEALLILADRLHRISVSTLGAQSWMLPSQTMPELLPGFVPIAVCGAHMQGLPLNSQLTSRGAYLLQRARTTAEYRLFALPGGPPQRPGLLHAERDGKQIDLEVWAMPLTEWGGFMAGIPTPLCLGQVMLEGGDRVTGFLCERYATASARDISSFGGWRAYLASAH
jgi:allophanate hydrolase